jgi:hypothetical protein
MLGSLHSISWESREISQEALLLNCDELKSTIPFNSISATGVYALGRTLPSVPADKAVRSFSSCKYRVQVSQPILKINCVVI